MYGWANADRLRPNAKGIASMAGYMVQDSAGKKHWTQSQNLEKPWHRAPNDRKYTRRQLDKIAKLPEDSEEFVRFGKAVSRLGAGGVREVVQRANRWYFYLTMRRAHRKQNGGLE